MRTPERAVWPLPPRPPVLPAPEPMPRPMRKRFFREPCFGAISFSFIAASPYFPSTTRTRCFTLSIMPRVIGVSGRSRERPILFSPSPISVSRWVCCAPHRAAGLLDLDGFVFAGHDAFPAYSVAASLSAPWRRACSAETLMLRRAATERGESWCLSASKVARTML